MTAIGQISISVSSPVVDGQPVTLTASISGDAAAPRYQFTPPAGSTLVPPTAGAATWTFPFTAATDTGIFGVTVTDAGASDSPRQGTVNVQGSRVISRFNRLYTFYNPGSSGPGTWILVGPGGGVDGSGGPASHAELDPASPLLSVAGHAVRMMSNGKLALARADDFDTAGVVGVVISGSRPGGITSYSTDGQVSRTDWSVITGVPLLIPGSRYFLSPVNIGRLVSQPPVAPSYIVPVGRAVSDTTLEIEINLPVRA